MPNLITQAELGVLRLLSLPEHYFRHPDKDSGQWCCSSNLPAAYRGAFRELAKSGYLLQRDVPGLGRVHRITSKGLRMCEKLFPKDRFYQRWLRLLIAWLWYKPRFYVQYGIWP